MLTTLALLLTALSTPGQDSAVSVVQREQLAPPPRGQADSEPFDWDRIARRLWTDSAYQFRDAVHTGTVDTTTLPSHLLSIRQSGATRVIKVSVFQPLTQKEIGRLLATGLKDQLDASVFASVAIRDTTSTGKGTADTGLVAYFYMPTMSEEAPLWHETLCIPYSTPRGLILDEGSRFGIPRCGDETIGGDPWPVVTTGEIWRARLAMYGTWLGHLSASYVLPLALLLALLPLIPRRWRREEPAAFAELAGWTIRIGVYFVAGAIVATGLYVLAAQLLAPGRHPLALGLASIGGRMIVAAHLVFMAPLFAAVLGARPLFDAGRRGIPWLGRRATLGTALCFLAFVAYVYFGRHVSMPMGLEILGPVRPRIMVQELITSAEASLPSVLYHLCGLALSLIFLGPAAEELLWRGTIIPLIETVGSAPLAVILSAAFFAWTHYPLPYLPGLARIPIFQFIFGLIVGLVFIRTRSIRLCTLLHSGLNAALFGIWLALA